MDSIRRLSAHVKSYFKTEEAPDFNVQTPMYTLKKGDTLPEDAQLIDFDQVFQLNQRKIQTQEGIMDTWALKYGTKICGLSSCIMGIVTTKHFRTMFNLRNFGMGITYLSSSILPNALTMFYCDRAVDYKVLTDTHGDCHACFSVKTGLVQLVLGGIYPFLSAYLTCNFAANKYVSYNVAGIYDFKGNWQQIIKMCPRRNLILIGILSQVFIGMEIAQKKIDQFEIFIQDVNKNDHRQDFYD